MVPDFLFCFSKHLREKVVPTNRKAPSLLFIFRAPMHHYSSVNLQLTSEIPEFIPPQREEGWRDGGGMEDQCQFGSNIDTIKIPFWYRYIIGTLYTSYRSLRYHKGHTAGGMRIHRNFLDGNAPNF